MKYFLKDILPKIKKSGQSVKTLMRLVYRFCFVFHAPGSL